MSQQSRHPTRPPAFVHINLDTAVNQFELRTSEGETYRTPATVPVPHWKRDFIPLLVVVRTLRRAATHKPKTRESEPLAFTVITHTHVLVRMEFEGPGGIKTPLELRLEDLLPIEEDLLAFCKQLKQQRAA